MPILFKHKKHILSRFLPIALFITLIGALPILIEIIGAKIHEWTTGTACTRYNCATYGISWYVLFSFAVAFILYVCLIIIAVIDFILFKKQEKLTKHSS